jgi:hypothetical protein
MQFRIWSNASVEFVPVNMRVGFSFTKKIDFLTPQLKCGFGAYTSQDNTLPKAKSKTRSKQNKDMHKCSSVYSERGVPLPVLTWGGE